MKAPELHGHNCRLRALRADDGELMHRLFSDAEVVRYSRINALDREAADALLARWLAPVDDVYWKVLDKNDEFLGVMFLRDVNHAMHAAEIGYSFMKKSWGRGIASDAVRCALRHGVGEMRLARIEAYVSSGNVASLRLLEKLGFQREGRRRCDALKNGRWEDSILLSRLEERNLASFGEYGA